MSKGNMSGREILKSYTLSPAACDDVAAEITGFCDRMKVDRKDALRVRLSAEECLLHWLDRGFEGKPLTLRMGQKLRVPYVTLEAEGEAVDPTAEETEEFGSFGGSILVSLDLKPDYSYHQGRNRLQFRLSRKAPGQMALLGTLLLAGVAVGLLGMLLPEHVRSVALNGVINPLHTVFFSLLGCIAGPMIFLSVTRGICGIGDPALLGRIGRKLMFRCLGMVLVAGCFGALLFPLFSTGASYTVREGGRLSALVDLLMQFVPSSLVSPFVSGNTLQIIFLAFVTGIALLYLGTRTEGIMRGLEQVNDLIQFLMRIICRITPFVFFLVIVKMFWSGMLPTVVSAWKLLLVSLIAFPLFTLLSLLITAARRKVRPGLLIRKSLPVFMTALTTASSAAAFPVHVRTCKNHGIHSSLVNFGLPLGIVMHRPMLALYYLLILFFFAGVYGIAITPIWLIMAVLVAMVMGIAVPPVPGGGAICYTIMFAQMGIPEEAFAVAMTLDMLTDALITAFEIVNQDMTLINFAASVDMLDPEVMRSENPDIH